MPASGRLLATVAGALLALAGCAAPPPTAGLQPRPGVPPTPLPDADFQGYVAATRAHIARHGTLGPRPLPEDVVRDRAPFALAPAPGCPNTARRGALLVHDLGGTPFEMQDLGRHLAAACFEVRAVLLPGHGTRAGDLAQVDQVAWREAVARGRAGFEDVTRSVVLIGFGLGGTLALLEATVPGARPPAEALILIAPRLADPSDWLGFDGLFARSAASAKFESGFSDPVRYPALPESAEVAASRLIERAADAAPPAGLPVLLVQSADDGVADPEAGWAWFCERVLGPRRQIWYAKGNMRPGTCPFVASRASDGWPGIVGFSHAALPIDPANPRLGAHGWSPNDCAHYGDEDSRKWLICADPAEAAHPRIRFGAPADAMAFDGIVRRLGWNPDFAQMAGDIVAFLGRPGSP